MEREAAHLPRKRGCSVEVEETRHCTTQRHLPVLLLRPAGLDDRQCHSNGPISQVMQWLHAISWRLHITGKERQGHKRNGVQPARETYIE
jgi:hypothetical protein